MERPLWVWMYPQLWSRMEPQNIRGPERGCGKSVSDSTMRNKFIIGRDSKKATKFGVFFFFFLCKKCIERPGILRLVPRA